MEGQIERAYFRLVLCHRNPHSVSFAGGFWGFQFESLERSFLGSFFLFLSFIGLELGSRLHFRVHSTPLEIYLPYFVAVGRVDLAI